MKRRPLLVYIFLAVLLGGLAYMVYFKPRQVELRNLHNQRIKTEAELAQLQIKKKQLDKIEGELGDLNKALAELEIIIPRRKEHAEILRNIQQLAFDSQLDVLRFTPEREIPRDFYSEQPILIEVIGSYHNLGLFADRVLHFPRIFNIDDFTVKALARQTDEATISSVFTAKTYFFHEESPEKPAPAKPRGR
jgi:Tfp pilus assembly protein PilO